VCANQSSFSFLPSMKSCYIYGHTFWSHRVQPTLILALWEGVMIYIFLDSGGLLKTCFCKFVFTIWNVS
jgi:hypothetical protein